MKDAAILRAARVAGALARLSGRGGGTALPGLLVEQMAPALIATLAGQLSHGTVLISGTNGKTTTAGLLAALLEQDGYRVVHNRSGSNLIRGIASALLSQTSAQAEPANKSIGVFEVDEATLPEAVERLRPRLLVLLNLFRDQLDRYGEVDAVAAAWRDTVRQLSTGTGLVLNADDPMVASLARDAVGPTHFFGVDDAAVALSEREHAADFVECSNCQAPYAYGLSYYGHLGHYACPDCGRARPKPALSAARVVLHGLDRSEVTLRQDDQETAINLPLPGLYNVYNLLAAASAASALGVPFASFQSTLELVRPVFGRGERFELDGKPAVMLLAKNPVGANQVLRVLKSVTGPKTLLMALNDGLADGRDVSWIWDVDYESLRDEVATVVVTGHRAADLALRLKHAGWAYPAGPPGAAGAELIVLPDFEKALRTAAYMVEPGQTLYVLPTYTAMLDLRALLTRMGVVRNFWESGN